MKTVKYKESRKHCWNTLIDSVNVSLISGKYIIDPNTFHEIKKMFLAQKEQGDVIKRKIKEGKQDRDMLENLYFKGLSESLKKLSTPTKEQGECQHSWCKWSDKIGIVCMKCKRKLHPTQPKLEAKRVEELVVEAGDGRYYINGEKATYVECLLALRMNQISDRLNTLSKRIEEEE